MIKRERTFDVQPFHDRPARAISKTPPPIRMIAKNFPSLANIILGDVMNFYPAQVKKPTPQCKCPSFLPARPQQRQRFINHVISGDQGKLVRTKPSQHRRMVRIIGNDARIPRASINEDAHGFSGSR